MPSRDSLRENGQEVGTTAKSERCDEANCNDRDDGRGKRRQAGRLHVEDQRPAAG